MMKTFSYRLCWILLILAITACSKNRHIPDSSILDEIPFTELSDILDKEQEAQVKGTTFKEMYPRIRNIVEDMSYVEKAHYAKLTYRDLFNALQALDDSIQVAKLYEEWNKRYNKLLPQAKAKAKELETEIVSSYRTAYSKAYFLENRRLSFGKWLKDNGYSRYLPTHLYSVNWITEDSWKYEAIIRDFIDKDFKREYDWVTTQRLNDLETKYPLAVDFLRVQFNKSFAISEEFLNSY